MKVYKMFSYIAPIVILSLTLFSGCEYDVAPPQWDENKDKPLPPSPSILQITPDAAVAGVNTITIEGSGFAGSKAIDHVSFNNVEVDTANIVSISTTAITVRRPNMASDSCMIKVNSYVAGAPVTFTNPYRITSVSAKYGGFNDNVPLGVAATDSANNIFVVDQQNLGRIYKILPTGTNFYTRTKNLTDTTSSRQALPRPPREAVCLGGKLYLAGGAGSAGHADIIVVNVDADTPYTWKVWRKVGKSVRFGDFDANGYFYAAGTRTDLVIIAPDSSNRLAGIYAEDTVFAIRAYAGYLYIAAGLSTREKGIWRHSIGAGGILGARELYADFNADTTFSRRTIRSIGMSSNGTMYIGTDAPNPLLVVDPVTKKIDYFYKDIVPPYAKWFQWGSGNFIYIMSGNTTNPAQEWTIYKVDMGITTAGK